MLKWGDSRFNHLRYVNNFIEVNKIINIAQVIKSGISSF